MRSTSVLSAAALCLVSACSDNVPLEPTAALSAFSASASSTDDGDVTAFDPSIVSIAPYGGPRSDVVLGSVQLLHDVAALKDGPSSLILANDRTKLQGAHWVPGDPRRGGFGGLSWGYLGFNPMAVNKFDPATGGVRPATPAELEARVVEAADAWLNRGCLKAPVRRVLPEDPMPPDIMIIGWLPSMFIPEFKDAGVLGITRTFVFVDPNGELSDIDGNGHADVAWREIYFNVHRVWSDNGPFPTIDLFSVVAHETGHGFGADHFGKVFVKAKDLDRLASLDFSVIKYAPRAMMNAVYINGRSQMSGTDNASFCQIANGQM